MPLVQHLTSAQLQAALRKRQVTLPTRPQSHAFYVEQCRLNGIHDVPHSELSGQAAQRHSAKEASIVLEVNELTLMQGGGRPQPRSVRVRVETLGMERDTLETRTLVTSYGSAPMRFGFSHTVQLPRDGEAWQALTGVLTGPAEASDLFFVVCDGSLARGPDRLGDAWVNLHQLAGEGREEPRKKLEVLDSANKVLGQLTVTVRALDALRLVRDALPTPAAEPSTPVAELSAPELIKFLKGLGATLPGRVQSQAYYVEQCRQRGVTEVSASELQGLRADPADAPRPGEYGHQYGSSSGYGTSQYGATALPISRQMSHTTPIALLHTWCSS